MECDGRVELGLEWRFESWGKKLGRKGEKRRAGWVESHVWFVGEAKAGRVGSAD